MRCVVALALLATSAYLAAAQNTKVVLWTERPGVGYKPISLQCNDIALFQWSYKLHELEGTHTKGCNAPAFKNYGKKEFAAVPIVYTYPGSYYYKCDIDDHCSMGLQYMEVKVGSCPKPGVVDWAYRRDNATHAPITVPCGTKVTFAWSSTLGKHDIVQIDKASCDASMIKTWGEPVPTGNTTISFNKSGTFYYMCSVPGHCANGRMLTTVYVNPSEQCGDLVRRAPPRKRSPPPNRKMLPPGTRLHW